MGGNTETLSLSYSFNTHCNRHPLRSLELVEDGPRYPARLMAESDAYAALAGEVASRAMRQCSAEEA